VLGERPSKKEGSRESLVLEKQKPSKYRDTRPDGVCLREARGSLHREGRRGHHNLQGTRENREKEDNKTNSLVVTLQLGTKSSQVARGNPWRGERGGLELL